MTFRRKLLLSTSALLAGGAVMSWLSPSFMHIGAVQAQSAWRFEAIGIGIKPALAIDGQGVAHVSFLREAIPAATYYATNKSGAWVTETVADGYFYGPVDIDVGTDDVPKITYHDHESNSFNGSLGSGVVLIIGDDGVERIKIDHPGHDQWDADIAAGSDGVWHVAGIDPSQFGGRDGLEYATNAFGDIRVENVGSGPIAYEFGVSIETTPDGADNSVGISYYKDGADDLMFAERTAGPDGTWTQTAVDTDGRVGRYSDLAYDAAGQPHISYWVFDSANAGRVRYATRSSDGSWTTEDVGVLSDVQGGFTGARKITAIELSADGTPHIMYGDRAEIIYSIKGADGWSPTQIVSAGTLPLGQLVEFDLDPQDRPHLVYFEATGSEAASPSLTGEVFYGTVN